MSSVIYVNDWNIYFQMIMILRYDIEKLILSDWSTYTNIERKHARNIKKMISMMMRRISERDTQKLGCDCILYVRLRQMNDLVTELCRKI